MPSKREMDELSKIIERPVLKLLEKNQNFGPTSIVDIMLGNSRSKYTRQELQSAVDLVEQCLRWVPSERITAANALSHPFLK